MGVVKGTIALKDNATAVLQGIRKEQSAFRRDVEKTKSVLKATWDKKYQVRIEATAAHKTLQKLKKNLTPLQKKIATVVVVKDLASSKIKSVATKVKNVGKAVATPLIKIKDATAAGISKIHSKLKSLAKKTVIPVTVAATVATAALGASVSSGMQLEQQQTAMSHFIQATNKDWSQEKVQATTESYIKQLRENANATPFETGEVIQAGSRAVAISGGNTQSAMDIQITLLREKDHQIWTESLLAIVLILRWRKITSCLPSRIAPRPCGRHTGKRIHLRKSGVKKWKP